MFCSPFTINLTPFPLPLDSIQLLDLGLSFIPTLSLIPLQQLGEFLTSYYT